MRKFVGLGCTWLAFRKPRSRDQHLKTYFQNGSSLKAGAPVCVDGVKLGVVTSVSVRPELGERPVEVLMAISTPNELRIPSDSTVILSTEGVLGQTFADIDTRRAHGPAIGNDGVLKSSEITAEEGAQAVKRLGNALMQAATRPHRKTNSKRVLANRLTPAASSSPDLDLNSLDHDRLQHHVLVRFVLAIAGYAHNLLRDVLAFHHFAEDRVFAGEPCSRR
jgi:MlaD protein